MEKELVLNTDYTVKYHNNTAASMKLDENERSTQIRLMKIQDMMVAEAIEKAKAQGL